MRCVNKAILIGFLGRDPEVKYTPNGTACACFSVATNERYKDKNGQWQDRTEWHNVIVWARLAEIAGEHLKKGCPVYIEGRIQTRLWDDKQTGQKRTATEIVANELVPLGGRENGTRSGGDDMDQHVPPAAPLKPQHPFTPPRRGNWARR